MKMGPHIIALKNKEGLWLAAVLQKRNGTGDSIPQYTDDINRAGKLQAEDVNWKAVHGFNLTGYWIYVENNNIVVGGKVIDAKKRL